MMFTKLQHWWNRSNKASKERRAAGRRSRGRRIPLSLERLEDRRLLSTFTVLITADSGTGSLRQAIQDANVHPNTPGGVPDQIGFALAPGDANDFYYKNDNQAGQVTLANRATTTATDDTTITDIDPDRAHSWWT